MVEAPKRERAQSDVLSDADLSDLEHCILCYNPMKFMAMGECGHKNVCCKCVLRMRLIMDDNHCSICKQEQDEIVITTDRELTWDNFDRRLRRKCLIDKEDDSIYYEDVKAKAEGMRLRTLSCLIHDCNSR
jgi:E3 ubiquitin-protein ligase ZNF598